MSSTILNLNDKKGMPMPHDVSLIATVANSMATEQGNT